MGTRRKSRELALQMLFQSDVGQQLPDQVRKTFWEGRGEVSREVQGFAEDIFRVAEDRATEINQMRLTAIFFGRQSPNCLDSLKLLAQL
jgi:N utilization substance protein B